MMPKKMRILVADDDLLLRRTVRLQLAKDGYEVVEAEDGAQAWDLIQREGFQLVVSDWNMPGLEGPELAQLARSSNLPHYIYFVLLTGNANKKDVIAGLKAGADDYLTKPFDGDELRARVAIGVRVVELERKLRDAMARLEELAVRDGLLNLYNRRAFDARLEDEFQRARRYRRPLSLVMLDIDHFKNYNDTLGHPQGDQLLRELANLLTSSVRTTDFVARYGGEEFIIILPETALPNAVEVASMLHTQIGHYPFPKHEVQPGGAVTVSVGVAAFQDAYLAVQDLLEAVDQALYRAKHQGRNRVMVAA
jgi:two-component system chemotaxis response regulator CheY